MRFLPFYLKSPLLGPMLDANSHVRVTSWLHAEDATTAFDKLKKGPSPTMLQPGIVHRGLCRLSLVPGDILVNADGTTHMVDLVGLRTVRLEPNTARAAYALHLMTMRIEGTPGWEALLGNDAGATVAVLGERLHPDTLGLSLASLQSLPAT